ncbi:MAG: endonuclease/exonuclease/phosphatase family metal-dependent hydrolase [Gammaproteobacteria bacterium]|jgi:endonuclease/exonuclease/phosphatase family metal-dependent hydrolase
MKRHLALLAALSLFASCASVDDEHRKGVAVLSYNIHHGEGTDGVFDLERLARVIRESGAELVALQEVDQNTGRAGGLDQTAELARLTGMYGVFGAAMPYDGGSYGEAVLSRWPILKVTTLSLSAAPDHEPRAALVIEVHPPGKRRLSFVGTHLDHTKDESDRVRQATELHDLLGDGSLPTLLVGDLNATPESAPMQVLLSAGWTPADPTHMPTYPSDAPTKKIDWILRSPGDSGQLTDAEVLHEPIASDHCPYRARWVLP